MKKEESAEEIKTKFAIIEEKFRIDLQSCNKTVMELGSVKSGDDSQLEQIEKNYNDLKTSITGYIRKMDIMIASAKKYQNGTGSTREKNLVLRFKQIQQDCVREFRQYQDIINSKLNIKKLYSASASGPMSDNVKSMVQKQNQMSTGIMVAMDIIESGNLINNEFKSQSNTLKGTNSKLDDLVAIVPGLDGIMNSINCKKARNNIIIGAVIAVLIIVLFLLYQS